MNKTSVQNHTARTLYKTAKKDQREILEEIFGAQFFSDDILERLGDNPEFADICLEARTTEAEFMAECGNIRPHEICNRQLELITEVLNPKNFEADYDNGDQKKWAPIFSGGVSGFGFSLSIYDYTRTCAHLGARLVFAEERLSDYAGTKFTSIYKGKLIKNKKS